MRYKLQHKLYIIGFLSIFALVAQVAHANVKIGFVNAAKIMESAPQVDAANKRLEQEFAPKQRRITALRDELRRLDENLAKNGAIMSEDKRRDLERDIIAKRRELQRYQDEFREDYNIRRNEELDKLQKQIIEVIQRLARDERYDMILSDGVVWASDSVDITDKVLRQLARPR